MQGCQSLASASALALALIVLALLTSMHATVHRQSNNINDKSFEHAASGRNTSYARFFLYKTTSYARKMVWRAMTKVSKSYLGLSKPPPLRSCNYPDTFRRHLKTYYFQQAFSSLRYLPLCASDSVIVEILRVYKFYLLTCLLT